MSGDPPTVAQDADRRQDPPTAARTAVSLPPALESLGKRFEAAVAREVAERPRKRRWRRRARRLALPVAAAAAAAVATAGAVRVVDRAGEPIAREPGAGASPRAGQEFAVVVASATADPGGGPPWVMRAYPTPGGRACVQVGRLRDGVSGQVRRGRVAALPASAVCEPARSVGPLVVAQRRAAANLTLVYGIGVDRSPVTVSDGNVRRRVQPVGFGAFVTILTGADPRRRIVVRSKVAGRIDERQL